MSAYHSGAGDGSRHSRATLCLGRGDCLSQRKGRPDRLRRSYQRRCCHQRNLQGKHLAEERPREGWNAPDDCPALVENRRRQPGDQMAIPASRAPSSEFSRRRAEGGPADGMLWCAEAK